MSDRTYKAPPGFSQMVSKAHCFECSEIRDAANEFVRNKNAMTAFFQGVFLPAPITWIEYCGTAGDRLGALIFDFDDQAVGRGVFVIGATGKIACDVGALQGVEFAPAPGIDLLLGDTIVSPLCAMLAMINTPRVFGRRQHMPHAGLQRKLAAAHGMTGKFPLRAWTEIKLEVRLPRDESESGEHVAMLTGRKCLHFCRAHLRVQNGQIVFVSSHWRGDPALGIKRSRYTVIPPRDGSPPTVVVP